MPLICLLSCSRLTPAVFSCSKTLANKKNAMEVALLCTRQRETAAEQRETSRTAENDWEGGLGASGSLCTGSLAAPSGRAPGTFLGHQVRASVPSEALKRVSQWAVRPSCRRLARPVGGKIDDGKSILRRDGVKSPCLC